MTTLRLRSLVLGLTAGLSLASSLCAAEPARFSATLTEQQKAALGLTQATAGQLAALDAAVEAYASGRRDAATREAAEKAVADYRATQEPKVVAAALAASPAPAKASEPARFTATLVGTFEGWSGSTVFHLDNGQAWRQAAQDTYHPKPRENVSVVLYKSPSGHWRLRVLDDDGAWVTVKRVK